MSLNMKSALRATTEHAPIDQKSDLIKSELAKYRMLKSKGIIDDDVKENKHLTRSNTQQSPSQHETSYRSALALVHTNSPQTVTNASSVLKGDYWSNSSKKGITQTMQSFYSVQTAGESFRGSTSHRDYSAYYSSPVAKNNHVANPRNSSAIRSPNAENTDKKLADRKSLAPEDNKLKEKSLKQIEQFVDSELEKESSEKVYAKTVQHTHRNNQVSATVAKSVNRGMNKVSSTMEMKASTSMEITSKNTRESKNFTPDVKERTQPESPKSAIVKSILNKKKNGVISMSNQENNRERKTESGNVGRAVSPKRVVPVPPVKLEGDGENILQEEIEKWRIFGKMMAESYDALNKKYTEYMVEKEKDKKIITALKEQVSTLKTLLKEAKEENVKGEKMSSKSTSASSSIKVDSKETVEFLKVENDMLKTDLEESQKYKELAEHFQKLSDARFKECSALAEEIICLRTDLDRSHSNYLRIQREHSSAKKLNSDRLYSGRKLRKAGDRESGWSFLAGNNSGSTHKRWSEKNTQDLSDDYEDQPPTPVDFRSVPSKEENIFLLRG